MDNSRYTIFTSGQCPWCTKVINVMANLKIDIDVVSLKNNKNSIKFLQEQNLNTVPQVFIGKTLIGGYEDTITYLEKKGLIKTKR